MKRKKINRSKPMFKKKRTPAKTALNAILVLILLIVLTFLGYSVGKGISEFMKNRPDLPTDSDNPPVVEPSPAPVDIDEPTVTEPVADVESTPPVVEPSPEAAKTRILYAKMPESGGFDSYLNDRITYAQENNYAGLCVELIADGGRVLYASANDRAVNASAVADGGIADLGSLAKKISEAGLVPYARVSLLTDHIVSWLDKGVCYLFENSTSTWLDDSAANGGKPWISAFSSGARDYMSAMVGEISDAGFEGIIAGEIEFPKFRNSDLNYIGASVKRADRYVALAEFSNAVQQPLGEKSYAIEVDAHDVVAGKAEILLGIGELDAQTVYVKYDSAAIGTRIVKTDESEISYIGLSETDKLSVVMKSVLAALDGSGKTVIPAVSDTELIPALLELGFTEESILVY